MSNTKETKVEDHDYSLQPVPQFARRRLLTMFMIMLGFTFFSASMWTGQTLGDSLDLSGFIGSLILGGIILAIYTGSLAYVGAKTGLSLDLLAQHSFGAKGSYLPSVLTSFTQIGWFGVGVAMFAIPVAKLIAPENPWLPYLLVAIAGICMTGSAFFGIKAMTIVSYISVPLIAILGITAMVMAVKTGDVPLAGHECHCRRRTGHRFLCQRRYGNSELCKIFQNGTAVRYRHSSRILYRQQSDVLLRRIQRRLCGRKRYF